jgi:hypothetical protein
MIEESYSPMILTTILFGRRPSNSPYKICFQIGARSKTRLPTFRATTMQQHGYLLRSGGESLRSEEGGGKPLPYIGLRTSRDAPVHQRSNHTSEHCGSRRNHRRGGVYPRQFWRPGIHTAGLPERRRYP